jgi:hypothetical protein
MTGTKELAGGIASDHAIAAERIFLRFCAASIVVGTVIGLAAGTFHGG